MSDNFDPNTDDGRKRIEEARKMKEEARRMKEDAKRILSEARSPKRVSQIENYELACQIGAGKYADVFMVFRGAQALALKILKPFKESAYYREIEINRILKREKVPNILHLVDEEILYVLETGEYSLVFELLFRPVTGRELLELSESTRVIVLKKVAETLCKAHAAGVTHMDINPSNILVDRWSYLNNYACVRVIDWGLGSHVDTETGYPVVRTGRAGAATTEEKEWLETYLISGGRMEWRYPAFLVKPGKPSEEACDYRTADMWSFWCFAHWLMNDGKDRFSDTGVTGGRKGRRDALLKKIEGSANERPPDGTSTLTEAINNLIYQKLKWAKNEPPPSKEDKKGDESTQIDDILRKHNISVTNDKQSRKKSG